jgi:XTP/dITP diphosphohydrolase
MKILIATHNKAKIWDYSRMLKDKGFEVVTLKDLGISDKFDETKDTFEENALDKALFYFKKSSMPTLAEDGGIEIDHLNGEPGVMSRKWLGYEASDEELIVHLRKRIAEIPEDKRSARFSAVACLVKTDDEIHYSKNSTEGVLVDKMHSGYREGFPYRAFFKVLEFDKYYMELTKEEYNSVNHRMRNVDELIKYL